MPVGASSVLGLLRCCTPAWPLPCWHPDPPSSPSPTQSRAANSSLAAPPPSSISCPPPSHPWLLSGSPTALRCPSLLQLVPYARPEADAELGREQQPPPEGSPSPDRIPPLPIPPPAHPPPPSQSLRPLWLSKADAEGRARSATCRRRAANSTSRRLTLDVGCPPRRRASPSPPASAAGPPPPSPCIPSPPPMQLGHSLGTGVLKALVFWNALLHLTQKNKSAARDCASHVAWPPVACRATSFSSAAAVAALTGE
jgi:hypothetical protein